MFQIEHFLQDQGIEYVTDGPNTKKGNINISCPWCGDDPSHHMGIEPNKGWYGCWRNAEHRGKNLARLISALTSMSYHEAAKLVGRNLTELDVSSLDAIASGMFWESGEEEADSEPRPTRLELPHNFRALRAFLPSFPAYHYLNYLESRGFSKEEVHRVTKAFDLSYCVSGWWKERIIIPVYVRNELQTWVGRSIYINPERPYLALDSKSSVSNVKECIYNFDSAYRTRGEVLFVCEGPGDVWRMDMAGRKHKCRAVGLFSMSCEEAQQALLADLAKQFGKLVVLTDRNELVAMNALLEKLAYLRINIEVGEVPVGVKDPGDLTAAQAEQLCEEYRHG